jgi:hypothetical protein
MRWGRLEHIELAVLGLFYQTDFMGLIRLSAGIPNNS